VVFRHYDHIKGGKENENGSDGVNFRGERPVNAPHRNTLQNTIIRDTGKGTQKAAALINKNGLVVEMENNKISGHSESEIVSK
jgi:hypothetical protein